MANKQTNKPKKKLKLLHLRSEIYSGRLTVVESSLCARGKQEGNMAVPRKRGTLGGGEFVEGGGGDAGT